MKETEKNNGANKSQKKADRYRISFLPPLMETFGVRHCIRGSQYSLNIWPINQPFGETSKGDNAVTVMLKSDNQML
jgi:hypothetical protein